MGNIKFNELTERVKEGEIATVIIGAADMQGKLFGKKMPAKQFLEGKKDGVQICAVNLAWDISLDFKGNFDFCNFDTGLHDMNLVPDLLTIRLYPWLEKTAFVMADIQDKDGQDISVAPRNILKKQLQRAYNMGYHVQTASELEFFIYKESPESIRNKNFMDLTPLFPYPIDNNLYRMNVDDWFIRKLVSNFDVAGIDVESYKGEWGNGQIEINLKYNEGLEMADQTVLYKAGVKEMAIQDQLMATFMAKPVTEDSGSSGHMHMSLCNTSDRSNAFYHSEKDYNLSETGRYFLGGVRALSPEMMLFYAPYVNSYKRLVANGGAPTTFTWGVDNRTTAFRLAGTKESMRIENRIPGADANFYLAFAAFLASGLYGIENKIEPGEPITKDAYALEQARDFPTNIIQALERFRNSDRVKEILGEDVVNHYVTAATSEIEDYFTEVTDWERKHYFEFV